MWYQEIGVVSWADFQAFLSDCLDLFSETLHVSMYQPFLAFFLFTILLLVVIGLIRLLIHTARRV